MKFYNFSGFIYYESSIKTLILNHFLLFFFFYQINNAGILSSLV